MTGGREAFLDHLGLRVTTVCRAWMVTRKDGLRLGFTDHDESFEMEGLIFKASTGMTARTLQQSTGLSVDNSEATGALSDAALNEEDILLGRFDAAEVRIWLVNWANPAQSIMQFRGSLGEISRAGGAFKAELRGLSEQLNQTLGKVFQRGCSAALGDQQCKVSLNDSGFVADAVISAFDAQGRMVFDGLTAPAAGWFAQGKIEFTSGTARNLTAAISVDQVVGVQRVVDLWQRPVIGPLPGDTVRLVAGCDKSAETCRGKFANFLNFRGFPHIPGEDWLASYPVHNRLNDGGSLGR